MHFLIRVHLCPSVALFLYAGLAVFSVAAFTECPLNCRVGENSPSLCPTIFSVMYTGMNFLPLWQASVCPTNSDRKSTRLNSSHSQISYAVFCLKKKNKQQIHQHKKLTD